jgi:hypothetical protein
MMCPYFAGADGKTLCFGIFVLFAVWILFVPVVITARLEKIIKLLEEKNKK